jgi:hypothetical protein
VYVGLNMTGETFRAPEEPYTGLAYGLVFLAMDPRFAPIRTDPRYSELLRRGGLLSSSVPKRLWKPAFRRVLSRPPGVGSYIERVPT